MDENPEKPGLYDKVIFVVYVAAISFYMYMYIDTMTDGSLSRDLSLFTHRKITEFKAWHTRKEDFKKSVGPMFWEAHNILEGEEI